MALGDVGMAMETDWTAGAEAYRQRERRTQVEDAAYYRQLEEDKKFAAMSPLDIEAKKNSNRVGAVNANEAEATSDGRVAMTNAKNQDVLAKYNQRIKSGVPQTEALAELSEADKAIVQNTVDAQTADERLKQDAPQAQVAAEVANSKAAQSKAERSAEQDAIAKSIGLDKTTAWAESNEAALEAEQARDDIDEVKTDRLNNIAGYEAATRINIAKAAESAAELQAELNRERAKSDFDMQEFGAQRAGRIAKNGLMAVQMARIGGDAGVAGLPLINMDQNGDGKPDYEGATGVAIQNIQGEDYLVAVDAQGNLVPSAAAPDQPGMKVKDLEAIAATDTKSKSKTQKKAAPVKLEDVDDLDDMSFDMLGGAFGAQMEDTDDDGVDDTFASLEGAVPPEFEENAEGMMPQLQMHVSAYLSQAQANGGGIAEARLAISTPEKMARNLYGANDAAMAQAEAMAVRNATTRTKEMMRAEGQDIDPNATITPDATLVDQYRNKLLITMMAQSQPQI